MVFAINIKTGNEWWLDFDFDDERVFIEADNYKGFEEVAKEVASNKDAIIKTLKAHKPSEIFYFYLSENVVIDNSFFEGDPDSVEVELVK